MDCIRTKEFLLWALQGQQSIYDKSYKGTSTTTTQLIRHIFHIMNESLNLDHLPIIILEVTLY